MASLKRARIPVAVLLSLALLFLTSVGTASHPAYAAAAPQFTGTFTVDGKVYHPTKGVELRVPVNWLDGKIRYVAAKFDDIPSSMAGDATVGWPNSRVNPNTSEKEGALVPLAAFCQTSTDTIIAYDVYGFILTSYTLLEYWCVNQPEIDRFDPPYEQSYGNFGWSLVNHAETLVYETASDGYSNGIFRFNWWLGGCISGWANIHGRGDGTWESNDGFGSEFGC